MNYSVKPDLKDVTYYAHFTPPSRGLSPYLGRGVRLQQLGDRTFELRQLAVNLDHLVRRHGVHRIDVLVVLGPLGAAVAAVEQEAVGAGAIRVDRSVFQAPTAGALALVWLQPRLLQ